MPQTSEMIKKIHLDIAKNEQNALEWAKQLKSTKILPKSKKWTKYPWNLKNDQNTPKNSKMTKIAQKPNKLLK